MVVGDIHIHYLNTDSPWIAGYLRVTVNVPPSQSWPGGDTVSVIHRRIARTPAIPVTWGPVRPLRNVVTCGKTERLRK